MADTLMLLSGGHPVHRKFGEAVGAGLFQLPVLAAKSQFLPLKGLNLLRAALSVPSGHPYLLCESAYFYPALKRRMHLLGKSKIININGGPILHHILTGRVRGFEAQMLLDLLREVDGHLVYGTFGVDLLHKVGVTGKPIRIIYPFIRSDSLSRFLTIEPSLDSHRICIIATSDGYNKGLDILFKALAFVQKSFPDATVDLVTRMDETEIVSIEGYDAARVNICKGVKDLGVVLSKAALYVQPSRSDMFAVSCLEAMAVGVPCIVSNETGAREVVEKVGANMVVLLDENKLASAITRYFRLSSQERSALSKRSREAAKFFNEKDMSVRFKNEFEALKKEA